MRRRQAVPPPERATRADFYRIFLGAVMVPLGVTILVRAYTTGNLGTPAVLLGVAFIGYGAYRLYVGITRFRMYQQTRHKE